MEENKLANRTAIEWMLGGAILTIYFYLQSLAAGFPFRSATVAATIEAIFTWRYFFSLNLIAMGFLCFIVNKCKYKIKGLIRGFLLILLMLSMMPFIYDAISLIKGYDFYHGNIIEIIVLAYLIYRYMLFIINISKEHMVSAIKVFAIYSSIIVVAAGQIYNIKIIEAGYRHIAQPGDIEKARTINATTKTVRDEIGNPYYKFLMIIGKDGKENALLLKQGIVINKYGKSEGIKIGMSEKEVEEAAGVAIREIWLYTYTPYPGNVSEREIIFNNGRCEWLRKLWG